MMIEPGAPPPGDFRALHFIPQDAIGGVEIAARSGAVAENAPIFVHAMFNGLYGGPGAAQGSRLTGNATRSAFSPRSLSGAIRRAREVNPATFVFSLWRTAGAFAAMKAIFPDRKFVTFIHNEEVANVVDAKLNAVMMRWSDAIWVDSKATFDARLTTPQLRRKGRIISLILAHPEAQAKQDVAPRFIYWGRLARQKRVDRAIRLFAAVAAQQRDAHLTLIGPDHGEGPRLKALASALDIADRVHFAGPASRGEIETAAAQANFFFQLSDREGMAMGVVEALQLGLVPVVTPVGQMADYCRDGENAVIYRDDAQAAARLNALLADVDGYRRASAAAIATFADTPTYAEDVTAAIRELSEAGR